MGEGAVEEFHHTAKNLTEEGGEKPTTGVLRLKKAERKKPGKGGEDNR